MRFIDRYNEISYTDLVVNVFRIVWPVIDGFDLGSREDKLPATELSEWISETSSISFAVRTDLLVGGLFALKNTEEGTHEPGLVSGNSVLCQ